MPGQVPLNNAKFTNSPDFNYQAVSGITGSGVFRQFSYINSGGNSRTVANSDLWNMVQLTGNSLVTIPAGISANVGDEILFVNTTGTISFTTSGGANLLSSQFYSIPAERPARLVYAGSNNWILAGAKTSYQEFSTNDCCGSAQASLYVFNNWPQGPAYSNQYGTAFYTYSGIGGIVVVGGIGYTISNGIITESPCAAVNFDISYSFYSSVGSFYTFYSYVSVDIFNDSAIIGVPFKTTSVSDVYPCDDDIAVSDGTFYRTYGLYGAANPVCFSSGKIVAATPCP